MKRTLGRRVDAKKGRRQRRIKNQKSHMWSLMLRYPTTQLELAEKTNRLPVNWLLSLEASISTESGGFPTRNQPNDRSLGMKRHADLNGTHGFSVSE